MSRNTRLSTLSFCLAFPVFVGTKTTGHVFALVCTFVLFFFFLVLIFCLTHTNKHTAQGGTHTHTHTHIPHTHTHVAHGEIYIFNLYICKYNICVYEYLYIRLKIHVDRFFFSFFYP
jgi:hypothetical protein